MSIHTTSSFKVTSWEQTPYDEPEHAPALFRAEVKKTFHGAIEAESTAVLLICSQGNDSCSGGNNSDGYVATERVAGRIGERAGSFVIQHGGARANGEITDVFGYIVPGSGTGDLRGIRGHCSFHHDEQGATFTLDYEFE